MKPMHGMRRHRPRNNNQNYGGRGGSGGGSRPYNRNQQFDSNGPDGRIRGTAQQVYEKYLQQARDASAAGDLVRSESLLQHAEHYFRILATFNEPREEYGGGNFRHDGAVHDGHVDADDMGEQGTFNTVGVQHLAEAPQPYTGDFGAAPRHESQAQHSEMRHHDQQQRQNNWRQQQQQRQQQWQARQPQAQPADVASDSEQLPAFLQTPRTAATEDVSMPVVAPVNEVAENATTDAPETKRRGRPARKAATE